jgi:uncharacterized alkaline shock family protein YloU
MSDPVKNRPKGKTEFEYPETLFVSDIDNKVFQNLVVRSLASIGGVTLAEGNLIDNLLHIANPEGISGVGINQDSKNHTVTVKVEVCIAYGLSIPEKVEEIQAKISEEITRYTGLHVSQVHVVIRDILLPSDNETTERFNDL